MPTSYAYADYVTNTLREQPFAFGNIWVGLYTGSPGRQGSQDQEINLGGYSRQRATFGPPSNGRISTTNELVFGPATVNWGEVTYVVLHNAESGGIVLAYETLYDSSGGTISVKEGDTITFAPGNLSFDVT